MQFQSQPQRPPHHPNLSCSLLHNPWESQKRLSTISGSMAFPGPGGQAVWTVYRMFDGQSLPHSDPERNSYVNAQYYSTQSSFKYTKNAYFDSGLIITSLRIQKAHLLRKARHIRIRIVTRSYFSSSSSASNSSSCIVLRGKSNRNTIPLRSAVRTSLLPKRDDLLPQHGKMLLGMCM